MAQWIRRLTTNQEIPGSTPGRLAFLLLFGPWSGLCVPFCLFPVWWSGHLCFSLLPRTTCTHMTFDSTGQRESQKFFAGVLAAFRVLQIPARMCRFQFGQVFPASSPACFAFEVMTGWDVRYPLPVRKSRYVRSIAAQASHRDLNLLGVTLSRVPYSTSNQHGQVGPSLLFNHHHLPWTRLTC